MAKKQVIIKQGISLGNLLSGIKKEEVAKETHLLSYIGKHDSECIVKKEDGGFSLTVNNPNIIGHGTRYLFDEEGFLMPTHICAVVEDFNECNEMDLEYTLDELYQDAKDGEKEYPEYQYHWRMYDELKVFKGTYSKVYFDNGDYHVLNVSDEVVYTVEL